jgi:hypothetical protein
MSRLAGLVCTAMLLLLVAKPQDDKHNPFSKYKAVEAYEVRPGILMMPSYAEDGQVCEIGLEKRHYSPEVIRLDPDFSHEQIDQIADELVPASERGPKSKDFANDLIVVDGRGMTTISTYENVSIQIHSAVSPKSKKQEIVATDVAATIQWKNRKCPTGR